MPRAGDGTTEINDFPGLNINSDADDIAPGAAQVQVNLTSRRFGELSTRRGFRFAAFDGTPTLISDLGADT